MTAACRTAGQLHAYPSMCMRFCQKQTLSIWGLVTAHRTGPSQFSMHVKDHQKMVPVSVHLHLEQDMVRPAPQSACQLCLRSLFHDSHMSVPNEKHVGMLLLPHSASTTASHDPFRGSRLAAALSISRHVSGCGPAPGSGPTPHESMPVLDSTRGVPAHYCASIPIDRRLCRARPYMPF